VLIAAGFAYAGATVLGASDALPGEIRSLLERLPGRAFGPQLATSGATDDEFALQGGLSITEVDGGDSANGVGAVFLGLLLGGLPMAVAGVALDTFTRRRRRSWSGAWAPVFLGGLIFQGGSLVITVLVVAVPLILAVIEPGPVMSAETGALVFGALSVAGSLAALPACRALGSVASDRPASVVA
jgi:hypothetical protein